MHCMPLVLIAFHFLFNLCNVFKMCLVFVILYTIQYIPIIYLRATVAFVECVPLNVNALIVEFMFVCISLQICNHLLLVCEIRCPSMPFSSLGICCAQFFFLLFCSIGIVKRPFQTKPMGSAFAKTNKQNNVLYTVITCRNSLSEALSFDNYYFCFVHTNLHLFGRKARSMVSI